MARGAVRARHSSSISLRTEQNRTEEEEEEEEEEEQRNAHVRDENKQEKGFFRTI
jgi:hypothetical protein